MAEQQHSRQQSAEANRAGGPEKVKEAALVAAGRLFAEHGIHGVSVREIAREIGVSHTLLHLYFGSKEEIIRQLFAAYDVNVSERLLGDVDRAECAASAFRQIYDSPELTRILSAALLEGIVPEKIQVHPAVQRGFAERLKREGMDELHAKVTVVMLGCMAIGYAVGGDWMLDELDMQDVDSDALLGEIAVVLKRLLDA